MKDPYVLTVAEASALLRVPATRVYEMVAVGALDKLPHLGRTVRITRRSIDNVLGVSTLAALPAVAAPVSGRKFCPNCGHQLGADTAAAPTAAAATATGPAPARPAPLLQRTRAS